MVPHYQVLDKRMHQNIHLQYLAAHAITMGLMKCTFHPSDRVCALL